MAINGSEMSSEPARTRVKKVSTRNPGRVGGAATAGRATLTLRGITGASFVVPRSLESLRFLSSTRAILRFFPAGAGKRGGPLALSRGRRGDLLRGGCHRAAALGDVLDRNHHLLSR